MLDSDLDSNSSMLALEARDSSDDDDFYSDNDDDDDSNAGMPILGKPPTDSDFSVPSNVPGLHNPGDPSSDEESVMEFV